MCHEADDNFWSEEVLALWADRKEKGWKWAVAQVRKGACPLGAGLEGGGVGRGCRDLNHHTGRTRKGNVMVTFGVEVDGTFPSWCLCLHALCLTLVMP